MNRFQGFELCFKAVFLTKEGLILEGILLFLGTVGSNL